jgi:hypothetical protein
MIGGRREEARVATGHPDFAAPMPRSSSAMQRMKGHMISAAQRAAAARLEADLSAVDVEEVREKLCAAEHALRKEWRIRQSLQIRLSVRNPHSSPTPSDVSEGPLWRKNIFHLQPIQSPQIPHGFLVSCLTFLKHPLALIYTT